MVIAFTAVVARAQEPAGLTSLRGTVRDPDGKPIASVTIRLQTGEVVQALTTQTDAQGGYSFSRLRAGVYSLGAEMTGFTTTTIPSIFLGAKATKTVDLTLEPANKDAPKPAASKAPEFYDAPQFTVSGVTDTTSLGGHGPDTIVRTRETLARETAALGKSRAEPDLTASAALEDSLRKRAEREPDSFEANRALGKALLTNAKGRQAIPYLERAARIKPADYENAYDLALANSSAGNYDQARQQVQALLVHQDTAAVHHLLADIQEKLGNSLEAVREFQRAVELDPTEPYLFDWGAELLLHHAPEPALEVFTQGNRRFARSARMLVGMGAACFARGDYEPAVQRIRQGSDLIPNDPIPYMFMGKIAQAQSAPSDALVEGLQRFFAEHPENAAANYYYAVALWKRRKAPRDTDAAATVESLLQKAIRLDPNLGTAYLQLGILDCERENFRDAIDQFQKAIHASPELEEAHYRLAQAYRETGQASKAKAELQLYDQMTKESAQKTERERHDLGQFLYTLRDQPPSKVQ